MAILNVRGDNEAFFRWCLDNVNCVYTREYSIACESRSFGYEYPRIDVKLSIQTEKIDEVYAALSGRYDEPDGRNHPRLNADHPHPPVETKPKDNRTLREKLMDCLRDAGVAVDDNMIFDIVTDEETKKVKSLRLRRRVRW